MDLRPYQQKIIEDVRCALRAGKRSPLIVASCGSGKTVMFSYLTENAVAKNNRVLILAHRDELLSQISDTLNLFLVKHGFIVAGKAFDPALMVHVGSVFSVIRRLEHIPEPNLIIIDEAHHTVRGSSWGGILGRFPKAWRIGVTATPCRLSGEALKDMFDHMVLGPSTKQLIQDGVLSPYKIFAPPGIDVSKIKMQMGDFAKQDLVRAVDKPTITGSVIAEYQKRSPDKRAIVFCASVEHSKNVVEEFKLKGIHAAHVDGETPQAERDWKMKLFRQGDIKVISNCNLFGEGLNVEAIETVILLRPTKSLSLYQQQVGRGLRIFPGKTQTIILDHANNCAYHGLPDEPREWTLDGVKKREKEAGPAVKVCELCFAAYSPLRPACPECGHISVKKKAREIEQVDGELVEVTSSGKRTAYQEQSRAKTLFDLIELGRRRGYRSPERWASHVYNSRISKRNQQD